jgi:hypothetical protein
MSTDQKIESMAHNYYSILQFFKDNPDVLEKWKNKNAGVDETPADDKTDTNSSFGKQSGDDIP